MHTQILAEIGRTLGSVNEEDWALAERLLEEYRRIFFTGQGRSGLVAQMAAMRVSHLGREAWVAGETTTPPIGRQDLLIVLSGSGNSPLAVERAEIARGTGAKVLAVTGSQAGQLAAHSDWCCRLPVGPSVQFGGSLFEQSALVFWDAVATAYAAHHHILGADMASRHFNL